MRWTVSYQKSTVLGIMDPTRIIHPSPSGLIGGGKPDGTMDFVLKTVAASVFGASIPAVIFYILM